MSDPMSAAADAMARGGPNALDARGLAMSFGANRALRGVDLVVGAGEVVALLGENGSGKSTLVKILAGYHEPEPGGDLRVGGTPVPLPVPRGAFREHGMAFVFQDLGLANELTVLENLFAGERVTTAAHRASRFINWRAERHRAYDVLDRYEVDLDPDALVGAQSPTQRALLAVVRAAEDLRVFREQNEQRSCLLVLDEPTVFLPEAEKVFLFSLVRRIAKTGAGVLFISHDMTAVREIAARAVVLRDGEKVGDAWVRETSDSDLIELVSGHRLGREAIEVATGHSGGGASRDRGEVVVATEELGGGQLRSVRLAVRAGEILGVAGLLGSGCEDLPYLLFGALANPRGRVTIGEWSGRADQLTPSLALKLGVALVPADRGRQGIAPDLTVALNMLSLGLNRFVRGGVLRMGKLADVAAERANTYDVRPRDVSLSTSVLSGGNQQKVLLARWLEQAPRVLLLHEPTQGVDVATRHEIYELLRARADDGVAIIWVTTDFDEMAAVADRIVLCAGGRMTGEIEPPFTRDRITGEVYSATAVGAREVGGWAR